MRDWVLAGCAVIGALIYLYADSQLPLVRIGDPLGPKIFPAIIGGGLLLSGLLLMLETYRKRQQVASAAAASVTRRSAMRRRTASGRESCSACWPGR